MNLLALDYGLKRIGVAIGSTESGIAFVRPALKHSPSLLQDVMNLLKEEHINQILIGLPTKHSGEPGDIEDSLHTFVQALQSQTDAPIEWVSERFTTKMAQQKLNELQLKSSEQKIAKKSGERDSLAAQILLQEWLDHS